MSRPGAKELRGRVGRGALRLGNMIRRMAIAASEGGLWGLEGYSIPDLRGGSDISTEGEGDEPTEVFPGIGIYARPADGDDAEALVLQVGAEADHPVIAATRNEAARARYVEEFGEIDKGEVVVFNSAGTSRVLIKKGGDIDVTVAAGKKISFSAGGIAVALATKADLDALKAIFTAWVVAATDGGGALKTLLTAGFGGVGPWNPAGTTVVKAE